MTEHLCSDWQSEDMVHSKTPQLEVNFRCFWQGCTRKPSGAFEQLLLLFFSAKLARWVASCLRAICIFCWVTLLVKWMLFYLHAQRSGLQKDIWPFFHGRYERPNNKDGRYKTPTVSSSVHAAMKYAVLALCLMSGVIMNLFVCAHMLPREQQNHESFMI